MRKWLSGLAITLTLPLAAAAQELSFNEAELYEKAKEEGELTWYTSHYSTELAEEVGTKFTEKYPGVRVNVIRASGQVVYSRLMQDMQAGIAQCDVFGAAEEEHLRSMKEAGQLQSFVTANEAHLLEPFRDADPERFYSVTMDTAIVLVYNTDLVSETEAPKSWLDLTDPKWDGKTALAHPGFSGTAARWAALVSVLHGDEYLKKLGDLNPHISRSMSEPAVTVGAGEREVGVTSLSWSINAIRGGAPLAWVIPEEGALSSTVSSAIPVNAPHPNAARLFMNYLQSAEASTLVAEAFGNSPINADAAVPPDMPTFAEVTRTAPDLKEQVDTKLSGIAETWRDVFGS